MFAKLAALRAGRRHGAALALTHSNVPRRDLARAVAPRRAGRYVLVCRWLAAAATGKLECRWQIEPVVETAAEAPTPRWVKGDGPRGPAVRLRGKRARPRRAA
jgi:hypothetical protein